MLVEFTVANYRSFRDPATLSMEPEPQLSERDKSVDEANIARTPNGDLLRVAGIYGANASGKSNLIRALWSMRAHVLNSAREGQAGDELPFEPFRLDPTLGAEPSELEVVFVVAEQQYRYGFAASPSEVVREWLYGRDDGEEVLRFKRDGAAYECGVTWRRDVELEGRTRREALHLSVAAAFNHAESESILDWFRHLRIVSSSGLQPVETGQMLRDETAAAGVRALIRQLDFGISDIEARHPDRIGVTFRADEARRFWQPNAEPAITLTHPGADGGAVKFDLRDESAGTVRVVALAGPILTILRSGGVMVIDELDAQLHTLLGQQIVGLFQNPQTNPHDAQLIFASHDTNLLTRTLLRRDQFWFVEKSRETQASDLYSLAELKVDGKKVRNDAVYEKDYLQGRYGAIPFFGNLDRQLGKTLVDEKS